MNWERGFKRVWYFILGLIWIITIISSAESGGAGEVGQNVAYLMLFSIGWQLFGASILWVARGFRKDEQKQSGSS
jgi:hypothetical protein